MAENNEKILPTVQWFPGHMTKARKIITDNLKLVDVVIELLDARIPYSSANPMLKEIIADKPRVIALNKADLADPAITRQWIASFKAQGIKAVSVDAMTGKGTKQLVAITGIAEQYSPEEMVGKKVMVLVNLKPATLAGIVSEGMLLCAEDENGELALMTPEKNMPSGAEIC